MSDRTASTALLAKPQWVRFPTYRSLARWISFAVLASAVLVTGTMSVMGKKAAFGPAENRKLSRLQPLTAETALDRSYFSNINTWASDHQALRSPLIALNSATKLKLFGVTLDGQTIVGKDGYYFYGHSNMVQDFTRERTIEQDPSYLRGVLAYFRSLDAWAKTSGRTVLFAVTPNKHNIYPDTYSDDYRFGGGASTGEKLDLWLEKNLPAMAAPMTLSLRAARQAGLQVYYRTDTHWSPIGAKAGTDVILDKARQLVTAAPFPEKPSYVDRKHVRKDGNFARLLGLPLTETMNVPALDGPRRAKMDAAFYDTIVPQHLPKKPRHLRLYEQDNADDKIRVLVIGDSFMSYMFDFVSEAAAKSVFYNPWGYSSDPNLRFPRILIDELDPHLIILQIVERRVRTCQSSAGDDEDAGCDGSLVPRLPTFVATPRLANLFNAGTAGQADAKISSNGTDAEIVLARAPLPNQLAIAKVSYTGASPLALKPAGKLASKVQYEQTEAELTPDQRQTYIVLNADVAGTPVKMLASRPLEAGELSVEVRIVADDVDLTIPAAETAVN